jgi:hypothetical protein
MVAKGKFLFRGTKDETLVTVLKRKRQKLLGILSPRSGQQIGSSIGQAVLTFVTSFVIF